MIEGTITPYYRVRLHSI